MQVGAGAQGAQPHDGVAGVSPAYFLRKAASRVRERGMSEAGAVGLERPGSNFYQPKSDHSPSVCTIDKPEAVG